MSHCISKTHPEYISLKEKSNLPEIVLNAKISIWQTNNTMDRFPTVEELSKPSEVNFVLKTTNIISKNIDKISKLFKQLKDTDTFWNKIQKDFQIPKDQLELLKNSEGNTIEEKLLDFVANYSYTVEINTAKEQMSDIKLQELSRNREFQFGNFKYFSDNEGYWKFDNTEESLNNREITRISLSDYTKAYRSSIETNPTQHHSNLTVPGGINYTENAVRIPGVVNVISANGGYHDDQFNQSRGDMAGWFRSDDRTHGGQSSLSHSDKVEANGEWDRQDEGFSLGSDKYTQTTISEVGVPSEFWDTSYKNGVKISNDEYYEAKRKANISVYKNEKTRRILEIQSFFQKVRDEKFLISNLEYTLDDNPYYKGDLLKSNQFLQLLNKDSNWVTFFVKSIIQDSAKKGYEKVLFPRLDTIIQIESQNRFKTYEEAEKYYKTPEWVKKNDEAKKKLNEARALTRKSEQWLKWVSEGNKWETEETYKDSEFEAWKKDRVSKAYEDWHSLQPTLLNTANFYEYELANRLDDIAGGNKNNRAKGIWALNQITDEYGNTWNEIELSDDNLTTILASTQEPTKLGQFKKYIKLPKLGKQVSSLNRALIQERIETFNKENNTSFYVNFEQVGEVANDNFKIISIVNKAKSVEPTLFDEQDEEYLPENQNTESQEVNEPISTTDLTEQQQTTHKNSQLNQYFGNKKVKKASELLPLLYGRTKEGFFYNLIQQVLKVFHNDVNVKVLTEEEFIKYKEENKLKFNESTDGLRINGGYVSKLNEIFVVDYADSNMDTIILHEVLHSLSYHYLRENTSLNEEFQDLYNKAKSLLSKEEKAKYAISDIDEFFAHLSDPNFIKLLASKKSVNTEGLTIWAKLKQILTEVLKSLGIEVNDTFLEDYFNLATRILQEAKNTDDFYKRYDEEYGDNPVNANATSLDKEINVQDSNFKALEKNNKTVSIREVGKHDYKRGDILTVKVNNKATDTKVRVTSVTTIQDFTKLSKQEKDEFAKSIGNYIDFEDFQNSDDYANATSPQSLKYPHVYKFITGKEPADIIRYTLVEKSIVDQESPYKKQQIFLSRKIKRLEQELKQINPASYSYEAKSNEIKALKEKLAKAIGSKNDHSIYLELGEELFKEIDELLTKFETSEPTTDKLTYVGQVLEAWKDFEDLEGKAKKLYRRYRLLVAEHTLKTANEHNTGGKKITREDLDKDTKDIRTFTMGTGALSDSVNIIARTIGSIIKAAQNFVATKNKLLAKEIQTEIDLLDQYAKKNGVTLDELYKQVFIQEHKNSTILTKPYFEDGTPNPNYDKIQDTPELKKFYEFYQKKIEEFEKGLPQSFGKYFIPNIAKTGIKDYIKNLNPFQKRKVGFSFNTENMADIIETKYEAFIPASRKESNLGEVLLKFGMYANNYEKMSSVLPEVRLLQEQLEYKINSKGEPIEREFINPSDPSKSVTGKKSKIWKQVDGVINMQVKGNMKDEGQGKYRVKTTKYDKEGNPKEEIYFNLTGLLDNLLKCNSLLRIGLSPITAISNVIFGDASNLIEAIGGQFFGVKDLTTASNIFIRQNLNKDSNLNKLLVELNPLQELDDYEYQEQIRLTGKTVKMSKEKAQEYIYGMQKSGEKWLQSRTMLAVLIHDGYMNTNGDLLQKYEDLTEEQKTQLTDKIQRLNQQIHGRYTQKEAAVWQQSVVYRMISQFRKWIPAAIESRIGSKRYDSRLQTEVEGRYITIKNLVVNLQDTLERLKKGELTETETYNMRKSLAEIIMLLATVFLYAGLKGDDDDKKRRKNPYVKLALTLLNRTAGDLGYFYDPTQVATIGNKAIPLSKTVEDLIKVVEYLPYAVYPGDFKIMGKKFSDTHKSGSIKGYNKFYNQLGKQIPGIKPIKDLTRIASDFELEELR